MLYTACGTNTPLFLIKAENQQRVFESASRKAEEFSVSWPNKNFTFFNEQLIIFLKQEHVRYSCHWFFTFIRSQLVLNFCKFRDWIEVLQQQIILQNLHLILAINAVCRRALLRSYSSVCLHVPLTRVSGLISIIALSVSNKLNISNFKKFAGFRGFCSRD